MSKKTVSAAILIAAILLLTGLTYCFQARSTDLPAGVSSADWVKLSETSGVLLTRTNTFRGLPNSDLHGIFYLKVGNAWRRLYFDSVPYGVPRPLGSR